MNDTIYRQSAIDAVQGIGRLATLPDNDAVVRMSAVEDVLFNLPTAQPEQNYCRECKWSMCHINVDKNGNTESYWRCLNWDGCTDEEGYCHEWERRPDGVDC